MSMYICSEHGELTDGDFDGCNEDPRSKDFGMMCDDCACEILDENGKLKEDI